VTCELNSQVITYDTVPLGEVDVRRGEHVHATDGNIGRVQGLVIEPGSHHVTHVLLQEGHLWGRKEVAIPIGAVAKIGTLLPCGATPADAAQNDCAKQFIVQFGRRAFRRRSGSPIAGRCRTGSRPRCCGIFPTRRTRWRRLRGGRAACRRMRRCPWPSGPRPTPALRDSSRTGRR